MQTNVIKKYRAKLLLHSVFYGGELPYNSAVSYGTIKNCYYLKNTAINGKYGEKDSEFTSIVLSEAQMRPKSCFGYLDFQDTWFIDTATGICHPQLISNPEAVHTHNYNPAVSAPTCTEQGYITHI